MADHPESYPETRATVWAKSFGMLLIGVATTVISLTAVLVQRSIAETQRINAERDIQLKQDNAQFQERTEASRLAASLIPYLKCDDAVQQSAGLKLLAPKEGNLFGQAIAEKCTNLAPQAKSEISHFREESAVRERTAEFRRLLANAREFKAKTFDGPAARIFNDASALIPEKDDPNVDKESLAKAKTAFADGRFSEAADLFVKAFRSIPDRS
jgi:hypothetical protein